ncbi:MAG: TonB-dependent receptor, partial [Sphingomonadales bacterium]
YGDRRTLRFAGADTAIEGQDASLRLVGRGTWRFDVLGYVQARDFSNVVVSSRSFTPTLDQRNTPATGLGGKVELRPPVGGTHVLRLGADYRRASGQLSEDAISPVSGQVTARRQAGGTNTDLGFFVEDDWPLGAVTLTAGARADRFTIRDGFAREASPAGLVNVSRTYPDRAGWQASFRGGMVARLGGGLRLRAAAYTGLRLPTLNELYRSFTVFPVITEANASLRNERLEGYEGGLDWEPSEAVRLSLTGFDNRVRDAIANVTLAPNLRQRQNIEAIAARGLEASAGLRLGLMSFDGALAYSDARARQAGADFDGLRPAQTPRWSANATAAFRPRAGWLLSATLRHVGAQFEDDLATDVLPAVT